MSPVVKRRLKSLLTTVRDAVQKGMKFVTATVSNPEDKPKSAATFDVEMEELDAEESKAKTPQSSVQPTTVNIWASSCTLSLDRAFPL